MFVFNTVFDNTDKLTKSEFWRPKAVTIVIFCLY